MKFGELKIWHEIVFCILKTVSKERMFHLSSRNQFSTFHICFQRTRESHYRKNFKNEIKTKTWNENLKQVWRVDSKCAYHILFSSPKFYPVVWIIIKYEIIWQYESWEKLLNSLNPIIGKWMRSTEFLLWFSCQ